MSGWFEHQYPYSNLHELNLDWLLKEMKTLESRMDGLEQKILKTVQDWVEPYVENELNALRSEMDAFRVEMDNMRTYFDNTVATLNNQYSDFVQNVNNQISALEQRLDGFYNYVDTKIDEVNRETESKIQASNNRTDYEIGQAVIMLREEIANGIAGLKVVNYFTGELIPIQDMTNFLCTLHTENAITYDELASANIDYDALANLHMTYEELALKGKSFILP